MDNSWVKLYRKIIDNEILFDDKALRAFIYLLASVNKKTGKITIARYRTSTILKLNPNTFKDVLKRLEEKYEIITSKSTNKNTEISLLNWAKYNPYKENTPALTPTKHQQNTNDSIYTRHKTIRQREKREKNSLTQKAFKNTKEYLLNIPLEDIKSFSGKYPVTENQIRNKGIDLDLYCDELGKKYKDYKAFLEKALRKDYPKHSAVDDKYQLSG